MISRTVLRSVAAWCGVLMALGCGGNKATPPPAGSQGFVGATHGEPPPSDTACGHLGDAEPNHLAGITAAHNTVRCRVQRPSGQRLPPLSWSSALAAEAQRYADTLAANGCHLEHSKTEHGENLFGGSGRNTPAEVVERWASEQRCFSYAKFPDGCSCTCGHYTQLVWADTRRVGCGMATCASGAEMWVCNYDPAGNYTDTFPF